MTALRTILPTAASLAAGDRAAAEQAARDRAAGVRRFGREPIMVGGEMRWPVANEGMADYATIRSGYIAYFVTRIDGDYAICRVKV